MDEIDQKVLRGLHRKWMREAADKMRKVLIKRCELRVLHAQEHGGATPSFYELRKVMLEADTDEVLGLKKECE